MLGRPGVVEKDGVRGGEEELVSGVKFVLPDEFSVISRYGVIPEVKKKVVIER